MNEKIHDPEIITKVEGAERLLKTATDLFFENKDMLSIHALSSAAHEVLYTLLKNKKRRGSFMKDVRFLKEEKVKAYHDLIHRTQNFLKHAARDPHEELQYFRAETPFWLFDAINLYVQLTGRFKYRSFALYVAWFKLDHKYLLDEKVLALLSAHSLNAQDIKDNYLSLLNDQGLGWWDQVS